MTRGTLRPIATGRFAPSPSGRLHLGNLRTGLLAWLFARGAGSRFVLRVEDLDPAAADPGRAAEQLADLRALGLDWDGAPLVQSARREAYDEAVERLTRAGETYPCYCTRREVHEAAAAPHGQPMPEGAYPGTCRDLSTAERREPERSGRRPALRLRSDRRLRSVTDRLHGPIAAVVDDLVLRRSDGTPAYNLAVVVDDAHQGVEEVVRGDDLLLSSPRQAYLAERLGLPPVAYAHVPLVLGRGGQRLAKRDGPVTLGDLAPLGWTPDRVRSLLAASLGLAEPDEPVRPDELADRFDPARIPIDPWVAPTLG